MSGKVENRVESRGEVRSANGAGVKSDGGRIRVVHACLWKCVEVRRGHVALQPRVNGGQGGVGWRVEWGMRATR